MYRSYSYNSMPQPVNAKEQKKEDLHPIEHIVQNESTAPETVHAHSECEVKTSELPFGLEKDDLILIIIIAILIFNDCDDTLLLLALAYIFFADHLKF